MLFTNAICISLFRVVNILCNTIVVAKERNLSNALKIELDVNNHKKENMNKN